MTEQPRAVDAPRLPELNSLSKRIEYAGLFCLPGMFLFVALGMFASARFLPPPAPTMSAAAVAEMYRTNSSGIILGMALMVVSAALFIPFFSIVADHMRKMSGAPTSLANAQLISGTLTVVLILIPVMMFVAAAFRPERSIELTQTINDAAWLMFTMPFGPAVIQAGSVGLAILADKGGEERILPRWVGFLCLWLAFLLVPASLVGFFKSGPFAWNGLIAFWLPIFATAITYTPIFVGLLRAIGRQHDAPAPPTTKDRSLVAAT
jgi:hypothetical protein